VGNVPSRSVEVISQTWYTYNYKIEINKYPGNAGEMLQFPKGIWMIRIIEEIKLLLLLGNRLKHIRGNVRYLVTWNIKGFTIG
jgi:hypothetical protein